MHEFPTVEYTPYTPQCPPEQAARQFYETMRQRRSVRVFSERWVPRETIEWCVRAAASAPSGANKQPWRFVCVADPSLKHRIRVGAEAEEREFYSRRASAEWLEDLAPLGTDEHKPFLDAAPWLIVVFKLVQEDSPQGVHPKDSSGGQVYYVNESVGIAVGLLIAAIHHAGLVTLTHTPSPMKFLSEILGRPGHERPYLLLPVGFAAEGCRVPDIARKPLDQVSVFHDRT